MGFLKDLFKRKPGGTPLGNTIRGVLNKVSGGILGNGLLMKQGENEPLISDNLQQATGAALAAANQYAPNMQGGQPSPTEKGYVTQMFKQYGMYIIGGLGLVAVLFLTVFKRKK